MPLNSLPNHKILGSSKLKGFADDKINVNEISKFGLGRVENIAEKGENAGNQHFLLFPPCFQKPSVSELLKVRIVWKRFNSLPHKPDFSQPNGRLLKRF